MIYCGIDPSISCTGIAAVSVVDAANLKFELVDKKSIKPRYSADRFSKKLDGLHLFKYANENFDSLKNAEFYVFENYSYGSPGHLADLGEYTGLLKYCIHAMGKRFDTLAPTEVKKLIAGKGNSKKDAVRAGLADYLVNFDSISWSNYDESDAAAIAVAYGIKMLRIEAENESEKN